MADSPNYYTRGSIEVWDFIRDQELNYHLGCAIKYICRAGYKDKDSKVSDLTKAIHYLENELLHSYKPTGPSGAIPDSLLFSDGEDPTDYSEVFDR
jgi:hypothetical protein